MNREDFLKTAADVIRKNFRPDDPSGGMTASKVGVLVRRACSNDLFQFGFAKLSEVLSQLVARGAITVGQNSKNALAIWLGTLPQNSTPRASTKGVIRSPMEASPRRLGFLQKPVWWAFVAKLPVGGRFVNRATGEVRMPCEEAPEPSTAWARVNPLDESRQKELAREFLESANLTEDSTIAATLDNPYWFNAFPTALRQRSAMLVSSWNRYRSEKVIEYVFEWCRTNLVPQELILEANPNASKAVVCDERVKTPDLRRALIDAIDQMSLDEILEIPIPAKYLISSLRPDLENHFSGRRPRY